MIKVKKHKLAKNLLAIVTFFILLAFMIAMIGNLRNLNAKAFTYVPYTGETIYNPIYITATNNSGQSSSIPSIVDEVDCLFTTAGINGKVLKNLITALQPQIEANASASTNTCTALGSKARTPVMVKLFTKTKLANDSTYLNNFTSVWWQAVCLTNKDTSTQYISFYMTSPYMLHEQHNEYLASYYKTTMRTALLQTANSLTTVFDSALTDDEGNSYLVFPKEVIWQTSAETNVNSGDWKSPAADAIGDNQDGDYSAWANGSIGTREATQNDALWLASFFEVRGTTDNSTGGNGPWGFNLQDAGFIDALNLGTEEVWLRTSPGYDVGGGRTLRYQGQQHSWRNCSDIYGLRAGIHLNLTSLIEAIPTSNEIEITLTNVNSNTTPIFAVIQQKLDSYTMYEYMVFIKDYNKFVLKRENEKFTDIYITFLTNENIGNLYNTTTNSKLTNVANFEQTYKIIDYLDGIDNNGDKIFSVSLQLGGSL